MFRSSDRHNPFLWIAAFIAAVVPVLVQAQSSGPGQRLYDPATETTVKGTVAKVIERTGKHGWKGIHVILKNAESAIEVDVGPAFYLEQQQFSFAKEDHIEVTGSKVKLGAQDVLLAREIRKGGKVLTLRDAQGVPAWRGRRPPSS